MLAVILIALGSVAAAPPEYPKPVPPPARAGTFSIAFTGDIALNWRGTPRFWKAFPWEKNPLRVLAPIFEAADFSVANMEGVLMEKDPGVAEKKYNLWAPAVSAQIFAPGHIDLLSTANNHAFDGRDAGVIETLKHLSDAKIAVIGTGPTPAEARAAHVYKKDGGCVAIVPGTLKSNLRGRGQAALAFYGGDLQDGLVAQVAEVASKQCPFVAVYIHWDVQKKHYPTEATRKLAHRLVDAGADLIVGHHPHVLQGVEFRGDAAIFYSLGNFVFSNPTPIKRRAGVLWARFEPGPETRLDSVELLPTYIERRGYLPVPSSGNHARETFEMMKTFSAGFGTKVEMVEGRLRFSRQP